MRSTGHGRTAARRLRAAGPLLLLLTLVSVSACAAEPTGGAGEEPPSPFADCAALAAPPAGHDPQTVTEVDGSATRPLPDVHLPCFTGGATVALSSLRGPAVVNLWASWCDPCRKELPALQRLADAAGGQLHVVGVSTRDRRESARSLAADLGLTFPNLVDRDESVRTGLGRAALPITLFVDGQGRIRHLDDSGVLDDVALAELARRHLKVAIVP